MSTKGKCFIEVSDGCHRSSFYAVFIDTTSRAFLPNDFSANVLLKAECFRKTIEASFLYHAKSVAVWQKAISECRHHRKLSW
jgi:hypothetical protein